MRLTLPVIFFLVPLVGIDLFWFHRLDFEVAKPYNTLFLIVGSSFWGLIFYAITLGLSFGEERKFQIPGVFKRRMVWFSALKLLAGCAIWYFSGPIYGSLLKNLYLAICVNMVIILIVELRFRNTTYEKG